MGERITFRVYKGCAKTSFRSACEQAVEQYGGTIAWDTSPRAPDEDCRLTHQGDIHVLYLPFLCGLDHSIGHTIGCNLQVVWLDLKIQEGTFWEYSLYDGGKCVDSFSTLPSYWTECIANTSEGIALANLWHISIDRVRRYHRTWTIANESNGADSIEPQGKAYLSDRFEYGDRFQAFDVLHAIGGANPMSGGRGVQHMLAIPIEAWLPEYLRMGQASLDVNK